jgi:hypothetical protein
MYPNHKKLQSHHFNFIPVQLARSNYSCKSTKPRHPNNRAEVEKKKMLLCKLLNSLYLSVILHRHLPNWQGKSLSFKTQISLLFPQLGFLLVYQVGIGWSISLNPTPNFITTELLIHHVQNNHLPWKEQSYAQLIDLRSNDRGWWGNWLPTRRMTWRPQLKQNSFCSTH